MRLCDNYDLCIFMHKIRPATVFVLPYAYATMRCLPSKPRDIMYLLLGIHYTIAGVAFAMRYMGNQWAIMPA